MSIKPTMAKSRALRKLDQKRATSSTERGTMVSLGSLTRSLLSSNRGAQAQWPAVQVTLLEAMRGLTGSIGELVADSAIGTSHAVVDGGSRRRRLQAGLEAHVIEQVESARSSLEMSPVWWTLSHQRTKCNRLWA